MYKRQLKMNENLVLRPETLKQLEKNTMELFQVIIDSFMNNWNYQQILMQYENRVSITKVYIGIISKF